jgi:hypothetical protein
VLEAHIGRAAHYHPFLSAAAFQVLVAAGHARIFLATRGGSVLGFAGCEVVQYPGQRVINVIFAGGVPGFLSTLTGELRESIEAFGRAHGCTSISLTGRPGWLRLARSHGWKHQRQVLAHKELTDGRRRG